ncbi:MAG: diguanylate cyclase [Thauera sp.]|jgi:diguanylate cyclase (GGDEF)-like protein|nr:diguanylate cyclase [Thauera sp.]
MKPRSNTTLFQAMHRRYADSSLFVVVLLAIALSIVALFSLRAQALQRLELVARTVSYSAEAAVLFEDARTANEILSQISMREGLREAAILVVGDRPLSHYRRDLAGLDEQLGEAVARLFFPDPVRSPVSFGEREIGTVVVYGSGNEFISYVAQTAAVALLCCLLFMVLARRLARRMAQRISDQLQTLTDAIHDVRLRQDFSRRVQDFDISEFDQLGRDFNALFAELHVRDLELNARQQNLEQANQDLSRLALRDGLTGLVNRRGFNEGLEQAMARAQASGSKLGLIYLDNDRFKQVNDQYGHAVGDELLIEVAQRIRGCVRDSDLVARLGGDEFCIVLDGIKEAEDAVRLASKIIEAMAVPLHVDDKTILPSVSIGIAIHPEHGHNAAELLAAADAAMYHAKQCGRGCHQLFDPAFLDPIS